MHHGLTALVIESHETVATIVTDVLRRAGVSRIVVVPSCAAARECDVAAGLALVDLRDWMRGVEDFEAFAARSRSFGAVLGLMASTVDRAVVEAARTAPCHFLVLKPFGPDQLRHKLAPHMELPRKPLKPSVRRPSLPEPVVIGETALL
jgi:DNA-binding NtrC family response regulator